MLLTRLLSPPLTSFSLVCVTELPIDTNADPFFVCFPWFLQSLLQPCTDGDAPAQAPFSLLIKKKEDFF